MAKETNPAIIDQMNGVPIGQIQANLENGVYELPPQESLKASVKAQLETARFNLGRASAAIMQKCCGDEIEHEATCNCLLCQAFCQIQGSMGVIDKLIEQV